VLSAGQRQRIALARAVLGNPKLVILDEPNANLDDAGERALANTLIRLKSSGTVVIMISHRVPVLRVMDQIAVMNEGRIDKVMLAAEFFQAMQKR
jgi:ATP-binding cassette subfamily C protein EexD